MRERTRKGLKEAQLILDSCEEVLEHDTSACGGGGVDENHTLEILYFQTGQNYYEKVVQDRLHLLCIYNDLG